MISSLEKLRVGGWIVKFQIVLLSYGEDWKGITTTCAIRQVNGNSWEVVNVETAKF